MSVEMITTLVGVVSILLAFAGAFGWLIHRMDGQNAALRNDLGTRIDGVESNLGARIDGVESKLGARIDGVRNDLGARIDKMTDELVEVKIAVARVEGPPRHLITGR